MKNIFTILMLISTIAFSNNTRIEIPSAMPKTSGIEPIPLFNKELKAKLKNKKLGKLDLENLKDRVKKLIDERYESFNLNNRYGISAAIYTPNSGLETIIKGYSDIVSKDPIREDMSFQIASVTKWMVSTLIFKLQEEGKLNIEDPISDYLPNLQNVDGTYTIAELLSHQTDIYDYLNQQPERLFGIYSGAEQVPELDDLIKNLPSYQRQNPLASEYSNTNYVLLAKIIEVITGEDYTEYLKSQIIEPLGLEGTFSGRELSESNSPIAEGWFNDAYWRSGITRMSNVDMENIMEIFYGLGDLYSTPTDLVKFGKAWMEGKIISEESRLEQTKIANQNVGYGVFKENLDGKEAIFHTGSLMGYSSVLYVVPEDEFALALTMNTNNLNFAFYPNRLQTVLSDIVMNLYELDLGLEYDPELSEIKIEEISGNFNGKIEAGERIGLDLVVRDVSGGVAHRDLVEYRLTSSDAEIFTGLLEGNFIETGYNFLAKNEDKFVFEVPSEFSGEFLDFNLNISDEIGGESKDVEFYLPVGESESSAYFDNTYVHSVQIPLNESDPAEAMTFEGWYNMGNILLVPGGQITSLAWLGYNAAVMAVAAGPNPALILQIVQEGNRLGQALLIDPDLAYNKWFHLAFSYNENRELKIYVNGEEKEYQLNEGEFTSKFDGYFPQIVTIGSMPTLADANSIPNFIGFADNVRLWHRELSEEEIKQSMISLPENKEGLILNSDFDGGVGSVMQLEEGNQSSANFFAEYGENTNYRPGDFISTLEARERAINVFPNPSEGYINLEISEMPEKVTIYDIHGIKIREIDQNELKNDGKNIQFDVRSLSGGAYLIEAELVERKISKIFIKK